MTAQATDSSWTNLKYITCNDGTTNIFGKIYINEVYILKQGIEIPWMSRNDNLSNYHHNQETANADAATYTL